MRIKTQITLIMKRNNDKIKSTHNLIMERGDNGWDKDWQYELAGRKKIWKNVMEERENCLIGKVGFQMAD